MIVIHKEKFKRTILAEIVRDAYDRNGSNKRLRRKNFKLKDSNFVLVTVGTVREIDYDERERNTQKQKAEP